MGIFSALGGLASFIPGVGPLVGGALSALGGALDGKREQKRQEQYNAALAQSGRTDLVALREEAEKAGFNPLTVLQSTGGAGFGTQQVGPPVLASSDILARSIGAGVETYNEIQAATQKQQQLYADRQFDHLASMIQTERLRYSDIPTVTSSLGSTVRRMPSDGSYERETSSPPPLSSSPRPPSKLPKGVPGPVDKGIAIDGFILEQNPNTSSISAWEERYGEPGEFAGAPIVFTSDVLYNIRKKGNQPLPLPANKAGRYVHKQIGSVWDQLGKTHKQDLGPLVGYAK